MALSSLSFDLSVYDIFGALAAGATVVIPEPMAIRDPALLSKITNDERVTIWNSVPALMEMVVDYEELREGSLPGSLRLVMLSGDWIPVNLPTRIRSLVSQCSGRKSRWSHGGLDLVHHPSGENGRR